MDRTAIRLRGREARADLSVLTARARMAETVRTDIRFETYGIRYASNVELYVLLPASQMKITLKRANGAMYIFYLE